MAETLSEFYDIEEEAFKCDIVEQANPNSLHIEWLSNFFVQTLHANSKFCSRIGVSRIEVNNALKDIRTALAPKKIFQRIATKMIAKRFQTKE